jgi:hypothetical protein
MHLAPGTLDRLDSRVGTPNYDRDRLARSVVHIGVGGFHRAHLAVYLDELATPRWRRPCSPSRASTRS